MNILITGGAGFIGSHIGDALIMAGHQITVVDNLSTGSLQNVPKEAVFYEADIRDIAQMETIFAQGKFAVVFHEAAQTMVPYSLEHPLEDADLNIIGLIKVLDLCRTYHIKKFIFSSSAAVYGDNQQLPLQETEPVEPTSFYGLTKATAEAYIQMYHRLYRLPYVILRYANVYGERQGSNGEGGVVYIFANRLVHQQALTIFGDGTQTRDFIYVKDVAQANVAALESAIRSGIYNVSTAKETTIEEIKNQLVSFATYQPTIRYQAVRSGDIYRSVLDNRRTIKELKWKPQVDLRTGLQQTYAYFKMGEEP